MRTVIYGFIEPLPAIRLLASIKLKLSASEEEEGALSLSLFLFLFCALFPRFSERKRSARFAAGG